VDDLTDFFKRLPDVDRQFVILPGAAHSLIVNINGRQTWHAVASFLSMPASAFTYLEQLLGTNATDKKVRSAPLPDKPSDQGLFGLPEDTGAAPIMGAPATHCFDVRSPEPRGLCDLVPSYIMSTNWFSIGK
jgi:hypothetical protein